MMKIDGRWHQVGAFAYLEGNDQLFNSVGKRMKRLEQCHRAKPTQKCRQLLLTKK